MDKNQPPRIFEESADYKPEVGNSASLAKNFVANVFSWMVVGLLTTAAVAWYGASTGLYHSIMLSGGPMPWIIMLSPFAFILAMNFGLHKFSATTLTMMFLAFAACMGLSLSSVFLMYSLGSVFQVFIVTAGTFGIMAITGYTTEIDLTKMGSLLFMGLIGIILASIVNYFIGSSTMDLIISIIGVLVFTGLIAHDTQRIKRIGMSIDNESDTASKLAILAATSLYLDFINLFLFLLRLLGRRN
jgi:hypothetical protein